jgi:hypothetical protein
MAKDDDVVDLPARAIDKLGLSAEVREALLGIQAELTAAYQKSFIEMVTAINKQASALDRLQSTLSLLVTRLAPDLKGQVPAILRVAGPGEEPDLASALVTADPMAAGYTMSQAALAEALGLSQADVSVLVKAFRMPEDGECAVVVRQGKRGQTVNYRPHAIERFKEWLRNPPGDLSRDQRNALLRVRKQLDMDSRTPSL